MSTELNRRVSPFLSPIGYAPLAPRLMSNFFGDNFFPNFRDLFDSDFGAKVEHTDAGTEYRFALPGVARENIHLDVVDDTLVVEVSEKSDKSMRKYSSRVTLAPNTETESLKAKYVDGLLTVLAPEVVKEQKKIEIQWDDSPQKSVESSGESPSEESGNEDEEKTESAENSS